MAILYICTGKYDIFWESFYLSCEKFFLIQDGFIKEYFVFTDAEKIFDEKNPKIHKVYQESLGWPHNTLMRFHFFSGIREQLENFDFTFFFNANMLFVNEVKTDFLPANNELLAVRHPGWLSRERKFFPYESVHKNSKAYISSNQGEFYYMGIINGGASNVFNKLIVALKKNIEIDLSKGIIAIWHDESHLNHYLLTAKHKILPKHFVQIEDIEIQESPKIIIRDKTKFGGHNYLRDVKVNNISKTLQLLKLIIKKILRR